MKGMRKWRKTQGRQSRNAVSSMEKLFSLMRWDYERLIRSGSQ